MKKTAAIYFILLVLVIFLIQIGCNRKLLDEIPSLLTVNPTNTSYTSITSGGVIFSTGGDSILSRGVCLSIHRNPEIFDNKTLDGTGSGSFTSVISGLMAGTKYFLRAYATNKVGTGYGNQDSITTPAEILIISTAALSGITSTSAISGGNISIGGAVLLSRGVCWGTNTGPTLANSLTMDGTETGSFISTITGLTAGTTYYVRAYATINSGTVYGNEQIFITVCPLPTMPGAIIGNTTVTQNATGVTYSISSVSGATGYTWTVPSGATIASGQGTTSITVNFGTLGGNISVQATNSCGNSASNNLNVITILSADCGTVTDIDGNVYTTVTIGSQCWMVENLRTTKFRNGVPIPNITDGPTWAALTTSAFCWFNNDATTYKGTYGALYNWYSVTDSRNIAPVGWHVPTDDDWHTLILTLDATAQLVNPFESNIASGALKEKGIVHWLSPNIGATNSSGFTALPCGSRVYPAIFGEDSDNGVWWSTTEYDTGYAWLRHLFYNDTIVYRDTNNKQDGFSVRCVKD